MEIEVLAQGDVVERTELLNGTVTVALEGATADGVWTVSGVVSWNRGLVDFAGEGDITIAADEGELFASLMSATVDQGDETEDGDVRLRVTYEIDGGAGRFAGTGGVIVGRLRVTDDVFDGSWSISMS